MWPCSHLNQGMSLPVGDLASSRTPCQGFSFPDPSSGLSRRFFLAGVLQALAEAYRARAVVHESTAAVSSPMKYTSGAHVQGPSQGVARCISGEHRKSQKFMPIGVPGIGFLEVVGDQADMDPLFRFGAL